MLTDVKKKKRDKIVLLNGGNSIWFKVVTQRNAKIIYNYMLRHKADKKLFKITEIEKATGVQRNQIHTAAFILSQRVDNPLIRLVADSYTNTGESLKEVQYFKLR